MFGRHLLWFDRRIDLSWLCCFMGMPFLYNYPLFFLFVDVAFYIRIERWIFTSYFKNAVMVILISWALTIIHSWIYFMTFGDKSRTKSMSWCIKISMSSITDFKRVYDAVTLMAVLYHQIAGFPSSNSCFLFNPSEYIAGFFNPLQL